MVYCSKTKRTWSDAQEYCQQNCCDLAFPKDLEALKDYLKGENEDHYYWLGRTYEAQGGTQT